MGVCKELLGKAKGTFRTPTPVYDHVNTSGQHTKWSSFFIDGKKSLTLERTINEVTLFSQEVSHSMLSSRQEDVTFKHLNMLGVETHVPDFSLYQTERISTICIHKQACLAEAEADYVYIQVLLGREIYSVRIQHETVHSKGGSINENVWFLLSFK